MRYLGIDYGSKRVGIALCDADESIVSPLCQLQGRASQEEKLIAHLEKLIGQHAVEALVVGLPVNMDGTEGSQARQARQFARRLEKRLALKVYLQDERLSSYAAEEKLAAGNLTRTRRRRRRDMLAACEILQDFLTQKNK